MRFRKDIVLIIILLFAMVACREVELVVPTEYEVLPIGENPNAQPAGMYLLNEGNMGSNKASIDFLDFRTSIYARNIYPEKNPQIIKELGDVGNDIQIYREKLYAVINCSHKVEVLDAATGVRLTQIEIPNCRYIRFHKDYAYVTSYVGPVSIDPAAPLGAVYKVNVNTFQIEGTVRVGYQPDELVIVDEYIYVANSGGYRGAAGGEYDNTVSVIQIDGFKQVRQIPAAINLHRIKADKYGKLWVSSRGDYKTISSCMVVLEKPKNSWEYQVTDVLRIPCSNMAIQGDSLYLYSVQYDSYTQENTVTYGIIDVRTKQLVSNSFITDGTEKDIEIPYGIAVHPVSGDIYVTDARNYVSSGKLLCYSREGKLKWSVRTGDIPAHMVFWTINN